MHHTNEFLPEPLPSDPFGLFRDWFEFAHRERLQPNPNAMVLATADADGKPNARVVLCKHLIAEPGYIVFFTNYESKKGRELHDCSDAAVVFHWDALHRQVRMAGPVIKSPDDESDAYFSQRPLDSKIGAWASQQSAPLKSRNQLTRQVEAARERFHIAIGALTGDVPRPPHWGGYRLWPRTVELWVEGPGRVHDRALWSRSVAAADRHTMTCGAWTATRLNP